jgi:hypothetical protein
MATYTVNYRLYFDEEQDRECYFDVQAESLEAAWRLVRSDYSHLAVDSIYEA